MGVGTAQVAYTQRPLFFPETASLAATLPDVSHCLRDAVGLDYRGEQAASSRGLALPAVDAPRRRVPRAATALPLPGRIGRRGAEFLQKPQQTQRRAVVFHAAAGLPRQIVRHPRMCIAKLVTFLRSLNLLLDAGENSNFCHFLLYLLKAARGSAG